MSSRVWELQVMQFRYQAVSFTVEKPPKSDGDGWRICSLCQRLVSRSGSGYFGLLVGCSDAFCLRCIREYRRKELAAHAPEVERADCRRYVPGALPCPICEAPSRYVMASRDFKSGKSKASFAMEFKSNTEGITCNFLKAGFGACLGNRSCEEGSLKVLRNLRDDGDKKDEPLIKNT